MKKRKQWQLLCIFLLCIVVSISISSCHNGENASDSHTHTFSMWNTSVHPSCTTQGTQTRACSSCGFSEYSQIPALDHTEVTDAAISATCLENGKTAGSHCGVCNAIIIEQTPIIATGHSPVTDTKIFPTCTVDGKTEGAHCDICKTILVEQSVIEATGHNFDNGEITVPATCTKDGIKKYTCNSCGYSEYSQIPALEHTEVTDEAISATCLENGKTAGSHCGVCNAIIIEQTPIIATGHSPVTDTKIFPTCTVDGKTEGAHCDICKTILVEQSVIEATGHEFDNGEITVPATCIKDGTKKYTCTVPFCKYSYSDSYALPAFTATELYNQAVKYVGEIVTYDKSGSEYALGTGFVISTDGKIVTNYHVLEGAYSATICIDGTTYNIVSVLAYDATIDLAVLRIDANHLTSAYICKNSVNVGETVYAIGSSRGMTNTYSQGIITYADRVVDGVSHIQHDASITHGNSGGPLINIYGEVIGINTWGISDSQNLNFAVFTDELDNLTYGSALTLAEFYLKECDVFERLKNYITDNGTYNVDENYYYLTLGNSYPSDYSSKYTRRAYYYADDNEITLDFLIDDGEKWAYFTIDDTVDGSYSWNFFDDYGYKMSGTLYAAIYDDDSLLSYSYTNISSSSLRTAARELASAMILALCSWIDRDFEDINVTAEDLCFYYF